MSWEILIYVIVSIFDEWVMRMILLMIANEGLCFARLVQLMVDEF